MSVVVVVGLRLGILERLALLGLPHAVAELAGPADGALEVGVTARGGGTHPGRGVLVLARPPVLPRQVLGLPVVADEELVLGVDGVLAVGEGELEELGLGDG